MNKEISLSDKYTAREGKIFLTGIQALVRLPLIQKEIDERNNCLLYTSPSPRDVEESRMPSSA